MLRVARLVLDRAGALPLRIGVNRGHVFAGDFGPAFRRTYSVKGDAINLAARVMGKAAPGPGAGHGRGGGPVADRVPRPPSWRRSWSRASRRAVRAAGRRAPWSARGTRSGSPVRSSGGTGAGGPARGAGRRPRPAGPARRDRRRAGHRQVPPGRRAAARTPTTCRVVDRPVRGVRVVDGVLPVPSRCCATSSGVPPEPTRPSVAQRLVGPGRRERAPAGAVAPAPRRSRWTSRCRRRPETAELDEQFRKARLEAVVAELLGSAAADAHGPGRRGRPPDGRRLGRPAADRLTAELGDRPWLVLVTRREQRGRVRRPTGRGRRVAAACTPGPRGVPGARAHGSGRPPAHRTRHSPPWRVRGGGNPLFLEALVAGGRTPAGPRRAARSRSRAWSPARSTGWTRPTGSCCATPPCSARRSTRRRSTGCSGTDARARRAAMSRLAGFLVRDQPGGCGSATP